jgi:hypothetical protein
MIIDDATRRKVIARVRRENAYSGSVARAIGVPLHTAKRILDQLERERAIVCIGTAAQAGLPLRGDTKILGLPGTPPIVRRPRVRRRLPSFAIAGPIVVPQYRWDGSTRLG